MKLYTNGCSFTQGHAIEGNSTIYKANNFKYMSDVKDDRAWPWQLGFDHVFNHGAKGASSSRITRTTIEFLSHIPDNEVKDWTVIMQFSTPDRYEVLVDSTVEEFATINEVGEKGIHDLGAIRDVELDATTAGQMVAYFAGARSYKQKLYTQVKEMLIAVTYLESRGANYLITGLDEFCSDIEKIKQASQVELHDCYSPALTRLCDAVPTHNIVEAMHLDGKAELHDSCGHPNKEGHKWFSDYILNELQTRGYIT